MLPRQLDVIRRLRERRPDLSVAVSCVSDDREAQIRGHLQAAGADADVIVADNASLLTAADLVLVASGTATLEVAYYRTPMVVMYDAGRLLEWPYWLLGRLIIRLPHLALVNILAGARVVPEFMPFVRDVQPIADVAARLLADEPWRRLMCRQLDDLVRPLEASRASWRVCEIISDLLGQRRGGPASPAR